MDSPVNVTRTEVLAELYETGVLVESDSDERIIRELTSTSELGDELRALGDVDPDLREG